MILCTINYYSNLPRDMTKVNFFSKVTFNYNLNEITLNKTII